MSSSANLTADIHALPQSEFASASGRNSPAPIEIRDIALETSDGSAVLAGSIDGFRVYYRFPAEYASRRIRADAFLATALLPAMRAGRSIVVSHDVPVSPRLLAAMDVLQDIFHLWYPGLTKVAISASKSPAESHSQGVASFFSGGVDGSYTFLKHQDEITHLVFVQGVDIQVDNDSLYAEALAANQQFAVRWGKTLIPLRSNIRRFLHPRGTGWSISHGAGLASFAYSLGFPRTFIAATHTYAELFPWGSHPLTDGLWSTEGTEVIHDGAESGRTEKLRRVAACPDALQLLRVCWQDAGYNCGRCEKCLRTMVSLRLLGLKAPTFPPLRSVAGTQKNQDIQR